MPIANSGSAVPAPSSESGLKVKSVSFGDGLLSRRLAVRTRHFESRLNVISERENGLESLSVCDDGLGA